MDRGYRRPWRAVVIALASTSFLAGAAGVGAAETADDVLAAARRYVEQSDRYLHHDKLRRGMKGYGLTVLAGIEPVKFQAEVISVVTRWEPHRDVIVMRLSGQGLEKTSVISGMSGSPIYVRDPADGKDKLIGAVAYRWSGSKEPIAGVQPITQMLTLGGILPEIQKRRPAQPKDKPPQQPKKEPEKKPEKKAAAAGPRGPAPADYLAAVFDPRKVDLSRLGWPKRHVAPASVRGPALVPLATPLMVSGAGRRVLAEMAETLEPFGIVPVQAGGVGGAMAAAAKKAKLTPGAAVAVALVTGDAESSAVGTVTDVIGDRVLAFGHSFFGQGAVEMPMGPAYVHTVIAGLMGSFKLSSGLPIAGALTRDENIAIAGRIGRRVPTIPVKVTIRWTGDQRTQVYRYHICRHRLMTPMLVRYMVMNSAWAWRELPELHVVRHAVDVDYGPLGRYHAENLFSDSDVSPAVSDAVRPVAALAGNPLGEPIFPRSIDVRLTIEPGTLAATMVDLKLNGAVYRPGETVTGTLTVRPFRKPRKDLPVAFELPGDLPEGSYTLTVCDYATAANALQAEMPQRFTANTVGELFDGLCRVVAPKADRLYLRLPLPEGGLALGRRELPDLPDSRARILAGASLPDTREFKRSLVRTAPCPYVIHGSHSASFDVQLNPQGTLLRQ